MKNRHETNDNKKKILILCMAIIAILVSGGAIFVYAAPSHANNHESRHRPLVSQSHGMSAKLKRELNLTPEQEPVISEIVNRTEQEVVKVRKNNQIDSAEKRKRIGELFKAASEGMEKNLTPAQISKYREMLGKMGGGHSM